jgi:LCP family protein required for cell wall assembly
MVYYPPEQFEKKSVGEKEIISINPPRKKLYQRKFLWFFLTALILAAVFFGHTAYQVNSTFNKISSSEGSLWKTVLAFLPLEKRVYKFLPMSGEASSQNENEEEGRTNILILGIRGENDPNGGLLSDTMIIASIKPEENKAALISVPRDLWVEMPEHNYYQKINYAYALGQKENYGGGGLACSKKIISDISGLPIHYAFSVDFAAFKEIIDTLGGVTIYLDKPFSDPFRFAEGTISLPAGSQNIDGETALLYARARYGSSDFDRARRQQQILLGIENKAMNLGVLANPLKITAILKTIGKHVRTDMELWELQELLEIKKEMDNPEIIRKVFDTSEQGLLYASNIEGSYVLLPIGDNFDEIRKTCRDIFKVDSETSSE